MELERIGIGDIKEEYIGVEGIRCDIDDSGLHIIASYRNLIEEELHEYNNGELKLGLLYMNGIIFIFSKYGKCPWNECPFSVHLACNWTKKEINPDFEIEKHTGIGIITMLIEGNTGEIKALRLTGAPNRFTVDLRKMVERQKAESFNKEEFDKKLNEIFARFQTKELVKFANIY